MSNRLVEAASGLAAARPSEHWYAVCCKPRHEENLLRQGYRVYLPRIRNAHHRRGQWLDKVEPLFPRLPVHPGRPRPAQHRPSALHMWRDRPGASLRAAAAARNQ